MGKTKRMNNIYRNLLLVTVCTTFTFAQSKVGTTAANFLTIPIGARASSMGGAFVAISDNATAVFWNPGGLSRLTHNEIIVSHAEWLAGTDLNWLGIVFKLGSNAIALSVNQLDYGEEIITTPFQQDGTGEKWSAQDIALGISYTRNLTDRFSIGGTLKYISERIWHESASAFALDIGLLFIFPYRNMRLGMNMANFGTEMQLDGKDLLQPIDIDPANPGNNENIIGALKTDSWSLPLFFSVGVSMYAINNGKVKWTWAMDTIYPNNQNPHLNLGTEITWNNLLSFRVGYNSLFKEAALDLKRNVTTENIIVIIYHVIWEDWDWIVTIS